MGLAPTEEPDLFTARYIDKFLLFVQEYVPAIGRLRRRPPKASAMPVGTPVQFVWVTGHSGAGKDTLIKKIVRDPELGTSLGLDVSRGVVRGNHTQDFKELFAATRRAGCVLILWQNQIRADVLRLKQLRPDDDHVVIHLNCEQSRNLKDFKKNLTICMKIKNVLKRHSPAISQ